jgi:hypothetical protein
VTPHICAVCKKPIAKLVIGLNGRPHHVEPCFGEALSKLKRALRINEIDVRQLSALAAYVAGVQTGAFIQSRRKPPKGARPRRAPKGLPARSGA